jgi:hypothetical protein
MSTKAPKMVRKMVRSIEPIVIRIAARLWPLPGTASRRIRHRRHSAVPALPRPPSPDCGGGEGGVGGGLPAPLFTNPLRWHHLDLRHHASVLVLEDVAVEHEFAELGERNVHHQRR